MPTKRQITADIILIASLIVIAIAISLAVLFSLSEGEAAVVYIDGERAFSVPLSRDGEYPIGEGNLLQIKDGYALMKEADCPDGLCKSQGKINKSGERIVCLPNRVLVEVE